MAIPSYLFPIIMTSETHMGLSELLAGFRQEFSEAVSQHTQRLRTDLQALQGTLDKQLDQKLGAVEKALSGPLSHSLPWDWIPDTAIYTDLDSFMDNRRLRYRGDPCYIVPAREYYMKYCGAQVDILKELQTQGHFYTPPSTRLFVKFGRDVVEGNKRILHERDIRKCGVPQEQMDLAWTAESAFLSADIQEYFPQGTPITRPEKEYFLDVIHTIRGIKYVPVLPISEAEQMEMDTFRGELNNCAVSLQECAQDRSKLLACTNTLGSFSSGAEWLESYHHLEQSHAEANSQLQALESELRAMQSELEAKRQIDESMRKQESETHGELSRMMETDYNESVFEDIAADSH